MPAPGIAVTRRRLPVPGDDAGPATPATLLGLRLRLPMFVAVSTALGAGGHALVDGDLPAWRLLLLAAAAVACCALAGRRREVSLPGTVTLLVAAQAAAHAVLALCHCSRTSTAGRWVHQWLCPEPADALQFRADDPMLVLPPEHTSGYLAHLLPATPMLVGHLVAAVVVGWWLRRAEESVWRAVRSVWRLATRVAEAVALPHSAPTGVPAAAPVLRRLLVAHAAHPHRGPPPAL